MAVRRMPFGDANAAGMGAGVPTALPGKPPMPMGGGGAGAGAPGAAPNPMGAAFPPPTQPPPQPEAGGPTSPMNIGAMLKAQLTPKPMGGGGGPMAAAPGAPGGPGAPGAPQRVPLPVWGASAGDPGMGGGAPPPEPMAQAGAAPPMDPTGAPSAGAGGAAGGGPSGAPSLIMLRLLHAMGQLPGSKQGGGGPLG